MKKKLIALLLMCGLILTQVSLPFQMASVSFAYDLGKMAAYINENFPESDNDAVNKENERLARAYVENQMGKNYYSYPKMKYVTNISILKDHGKAVYTKAQDDHYDYTGMGDLQKGEDKKWHYKHLGYTRNESDPVKVTNPLFPNVKGTTDFFSTYKSKNWSDIKKNENRPSWSGVRKEIEKYMLTMGKTRVQDDGRITPTHDLQMDDILIKSVPSRSIDVLKDFIKLSTHPSLKYWGSVIIWHKTASGAYFYRTVDVAPVPFENGVLTLKPSQEHIEFGKEEEVKTIQVEASISFPSFTPLNGWGLKDYIKDGTITVNGQESGIRIDNSTKTIKADFELELKRENFKSGQWTEKELTGTYKIIAQDYFNKDEFIGSGSTSYKVLVNAGEVEPYFVIKNNGVDVTDGVIEYKDWQDVNLTLEPSNRVSKPNEITDVLWVMKSFPEGSGLSEFKFGNQNVSYTMTQPKLSTHADSNGTVTFTMLIKTLYNFDYGGLKGIDEYIVPHTVTFKKIDEDEEDPTLPQTKEPVARLGAPSKVRMGDRFTLSGTGSYDPDGEIVDYDFKLQAIREIEWLNDEKSRVKATVMSTSDNDIKLVVTDDDGLEDSTSDDIEILPPVEAKMRVDGLRKVNRKVTLNASESIDAYYFPIDDYAWTITPLDGQSNTVNYGTSDTANINYETNNKGEKVNVLIKEPGAYQVKLNIHAQCTLEGDENYEASDSLSFPIMIQPDLKPRAGLTVISLALRDKMDDLNASIEMLDTSYSEDGDQTRVKQWYARHDSDNDGDRTDETWTPIGTAKVHELYKTKKLGEYDFYHEVVEVIPEEDTISKFLTESDYLTDNSLDQAYEERYCHVDNVAPVISTTAELEKEIDLLVITDEDGENYTNLLAEVNKLTKEMYERKFGVNHEIVNLNDETLPRKTVGLKKEQVFNWHRKWFVKFFWKYAFSYKPWKVTNNIERVVSGVIDTKVGTIDDMLEYEKYPNSRVEVDRVYNDRGETGGGMDFEKITGIDVSVYDDLYDCRESFSRGLSQYLGTYDSSSNFHYFSNDNIKIDTNFTSALSNFFRVDKAPLVSAYTSDGWVQGELVLESDKGFNVNLLDSYIESYKDSKNDKYLILAIKNGENLFLPESLRQKIEDCGFKVYFSMDSYYGEFSPKIQDLVSLEFENDALYAQTKYGNQLKNHNETEVENVYYKYQRSEDDPVNFKNSINDFQKVEALNEGSTWIYAFMQTSSPITSTTKQYRLDGFTGTPPSGFLNSHETIIAVDYPDYEWFKEREGFIEKKNIVVGERLTLERSGHDIYVKSVYQIDNNACIIVGEDNKVYYVANEALEYVSWHQSKELLVAKELNISGIESVYALSYTNAYFSKAINLKILPSTAFIVKDFNGRYVYCTMTYEKANWNAIFNDMHTIYFDDLSMFEYDLGQELYWKVGWEQMNYSDDNTSTFYNLNSHALLFSTEYESTNDFFRLHVYSNIVDLHKWYVPKGGNGYWSRTGINGIDHKFNYFHWALVDENGDLYHNGEKIASNVVACSLDNREDNKSIAYISKDGQVYGKGTSRKGQLGDFEYHSDFVKVFNSPYTLNAEYSLKDYASPYDISSSSPAYMMVDRGAYSDITAKLLEEYADYEETETVFIQVGDTIDIGGFVLDYEGDSIYQKRIDVTHDNTYFDNADTAWVPPADFDGPVTVDVPGRMEIRLRAQDNPVGNDERFAEYRYWNKDNTSIEVIAHRPPIAKLGYALVPQGDGTFNFSGTDNGSYDLDHSQSRTDKGIADRQFYYRKELDPTWTAFDGTLPIENGVKYQFALRVKDIENAWSDYDIVDIKITGEPFVLSASVNPPYPESVPAGANITIYANVFTYKAMDSVKAYIKDGNDLIAEVDLSQDSVDGMERKYSKTYTLSNDLPDKDHYKVIVVATPKDGSVPKEVPLKLKVDTPISVKGTVNPDSITIGQTGALTAQTTIYADECQVNLYDGTGKAVLVTLLKDGVPSGGMQNWKAAHVFNEDMEEGTYTAKFHAKTENGNEAEDSVSFYFIPNQAPTISYKPIDQEKLYEGDDVKVIFEYDDPDGDDLQLNVYKSMDQGVTWTLIQEKVSCSVPGSTEQTFEDIPSGDVLFRAEVFDSLGEKGETQGAIRVNPVELFSFRVTQITDHAFKDTSMPIYVGNMAIDESNHKDNKLMKLGYAFNFEIDSKGLFNDDDTVLIMPKFKTEAGEPLDMYYEDEINDLILGVSGSGGTRDPNDRFKLYYTGDMKPGEELGSFSVLMLPVGLRSMQENYETWKGRYGLPTSAVLVREGTEPRDTNNHYKGKIVVEFVPQAVKKGSVRFNYVHSGMWEKERFENGGKINIVKYDKYNQGECILIDASTSSQDDYDSDRFLR